LEPWDLVWFVSTKKGNRGGELWGCARYFRCEDPIDPESEHAEAEWNECRHGLDISLNQWIGKEGMPKGYRKHIYPIEFGRPQKLKKRPEVHLDFQGWFCTKANKYQIFEDLEWEEWV